MSRVAKIPVVVPKNVDITLTKDVITVAGGMGTLSLAAHPKVNVVQEAGELHFSPEDMTKSARMAAGTIRSLVNNMVVGVSQGFQKKLELIGVGYRAKATGNVLNLTLGYSHPIEFELPAAVKVETPTQTEIVLKSSNKQLLGQVAAKIRGYRPPEPYKGKGIRYSDETVLRKEAKKK